MKSTFYLILLTLLVSSCGIKSDSGDISRKDLEKQLEDIKTFIAATSCEDAASCKYIEYGSKSCGGPTGFLYFSGSIDETQLKEMVDTYTLAERKYNVENDILSDCMLEMPAETIKCRGGKCIQVR